MGGKRNRRTLTHRRWDVVHGRYYRLTGEGARIVQAEIEGTLKRLQPTRSQARSLWREWPPGDCVGLALSIVVAEVFDWTPSIAARPIRRAAQRLPSEVRSRYQDEWLAELDALPGRRISPLIFAVSYLHRSFRCETRGFGSIQVSDSRPAHGIQVRSRLRCRCDISDFAFAPLALGCPCRACRLSWSGAVSPPTSRL